MSGSQKENSVKKQILSYLKAIGIFAWQNNTVGIYDARRKAHRKHSGSLCGVSDILGILPDGRFLAIEVKRADEFDEFGKMDRSYPSKEQKLFLENINMFGGLGFVARSIEDVLVYLNGGKNDAIDEGVKSGDDIGEHK